MSEYTVLCLTAANGKALTKSFDKEGIAAPFNKVSLFTHDEIEATNLEVLYHLLKRIENEVSTAIVSGVLSGEARKLKQIKRNKKTIIDKRRAWICLDIDKFDLPDGYDVVDEPEKCVEYAITTAFPPEFHNTQYIYQLSSSCGVKSRKILSCHLFFMLHKPAKLENVKEALSGYKDIIDPSTLSPSQIIYIAKPRFEVAEDDPFLDRDRIGLIQEDRDMTSVILSSHTINSSGTLNPKRSKQTNKDKSESGIDSIYDALPALNNAIGDTAGKVGFYSPIRAYTAYIATHMWHYYVLEYIENQKHFIRESIMNAEKSSTRPEWEIERYCSDEFLDGLIYGAIKKDFGNKFRDDVDSRYQYIEIGFLGAYIQMGKAFKVISKPLIENVQLKSRHPNAEIPNKRNFTKLIKATAGLGKTTEVIYLINKFLTIERPIPINFELYVPSHRLGTEIVESIKNYKLQFHTYPLHKPHIEASHVVGRTQSKNGIDVCNRKSEVEEATKLGKAVGRELCGEHLQDHDKERCRFFDECEYQKQFRTWKERKNDQHIYIMSHDYLFIRRREGLPKPDLVIVDETFYSKSIKEIVVQQPLALFNEYHESNIINAIREYTIDNANLLTKFKESNVTPDSMRRLAKSFKKREDDGESKYLAFDIVLEGLADELEEFPSRCESRLLKVGGNKQNGEHQIVLEYRKRRELTFPADTPLLMIDADGDKDIAQLFRKNHSLNYEEIAAERVAIVNQFSDRTWSRNSIINNTKLKEQTLQFLQDITADNDDTIIVMDKKLLDMFGFRREQIKVNGELNTRYYCNNAPVIHFGGFRGSNEFKDYSNIVIVGRNEPPVISMENQAAALWYDDEEDIKTIPADDSGNVNYIKSKVAYRMGDGSIETASVSTHPDERVDKLLRLARETETTQAIDRLRSVRSSLDDNKTVWILCNIPVDIRVENLMSWDDYQTLVEIVNTEDCFVVHKEFPYFKEMKKATKSTNLQKWRKFTQSNSSSISLTERTQFLVTTDSNSKFTAYIAANYDGSKEELIASKLGKTAEDITVIEMDRKPN